MKLKMTVYYHDKNTWGLKHLLIDQSVDYITLYEAM
jgi:hypothetical protein